MPDLNKKLTDLLSRKSWGENKKSFLEWLGLGLLKIFKESFKDATKKIIVGGILVTLGAIGTLAYQKVNPEMIKINIRGKVLDEEGRGVKGAEVMAENIKGKTVSDDDGNFKYTAEIEKKVTYITLYCRKNGYETSPNTRENIESTSVHGDDKIIEVYFLLEKNVDSLH